MTRLRTRSIIFLAAALACVAAAAPAHASAIPGATYTGSEDWGATVEFAVNSDGTSLSAVKVRGHSAGGTCLGETDPYDAPVDSTAVIPIVDDRFEGEVEPDLWFIGGFDSAGAASGYFQCQSGWSPNWWYATASGSSPPPPSLASYDVPANGAAVRAGTRIRGTVPPALDADDGVFYSVRSKTSGTRVASWYGSRNDVSNALEDLTITYRGKHSRRCTQTVAVYNWTTGAWVGLDSRRVGASEVELTLRPRGTLADYVSGASGNGELGVRVRCKRSDQVNFVSYGEKLRFAYRAP